MYLRKRKDFINVIEDNLAEEQLRQRGYHVLVLKKYRCNVYALRPGARSREEVSLNADFVFKYSNSTVYLLIVP